MVYMVFATITTGLIGKAFGKTDGANAGKQRS